MDQGLDWRKLDRYLAGESSADETIEVQRWLAAAPERAEMIAALQDANRPTGEGDVDAAWQRLRTRMRKVEPTAAAGTVPQRGRPAGARVRLAGRRALRRIGRGPALRVAAMAVLILGAVTWWMNQPGPAGAYAAAEIITRPGERRSATLPDGSEVVIAPASRIRYLRRGEDADRVVELEGKAYFRVVADPEHPFLVRAAGAETRVLGTEFDVQAFPEDDRVQVIVTEGRVSLRTLGRPDGAVVLERGDLGQVVADGEIDVSHGIDIDRYIAWTAGGILFDDVSLGQALPELERRLGVELRLADPALATRRFTIELHTDSLDEVLEAISLVLDLSYVQTRDTVTLSPNP